MDEVEKNIVIFVIGEQINHLQRLKAEANNLSVGH